MDYFKRLYSRVEIYYNQSFLLLYWGHSSEAGCLLRVCGGEAHCPKDTDGPPAWTGMEALAVLFPLPLHHQHQC